MMAAFWVPFTHLFTETIPEIVARKASTCSKDCRKASNSDSIGSNDVIISPSVVLDKKAELKLRTYQSELAFPAFEGKNAIICAPTNSGKTYVAIAIAQEHLKMLKEVDCGRFRRPLKVLFIVNKVNLVLQQRQRFDYYLSNRYGIFF